MQIDILFEDEDLVVINKPAGLVVHPAAGHAQDTLVNILLHHVGQLAMGFAENRPVLLGPVEAASRKDASRAALDDQLGPIAPVQTRPPFTPQ